jgi:hypothetical protein
MAVQKVKGKGLKGVPRTEYEEKKVVTTLSLTPTAIVLFDTAATLLNLSRTALMERLARGDEEVWEAIKQAPSQLEVRG